MKTEKKKILSKYCFYKYSVKIAGHGKLQQKNTIANYRTHYYVNIPVLFPIFPHCY